MNSTNDGSTNDGAIIIHGLQAKATKRGGVVREGCIEATANAEIIPGVSIRLFGTQKRYRQPDGQPVDVAYDITYKVGDMAEHSSYNLSYRGVITHITGKSVTFRDTFHKVKRLSIYEFNWRNHNGQDSKIKQNRDWLD